LKELLRGLLKKLKLLPGILGEKYSIERNPIST
jgi:hypothetical protein